MGILDIDVARNNATLIHKIPYFDRRNIIYERKEKNDYILCYSKYLPGSIEILIDPIAYLMLCACDGEKSIIGIVENLMEFFSRVEKDELYGDFINVLKTYSETGLITWGEGGNPFMQSLVKKIDDRAQLSIAVEEDIRDIIEFYNSLNNERRSDYIYYVNHEEEESNFYNEIAIRQNLFAFKQEYILYKEDNKILGVVCIKTPESSINGTAKISYIISPKNKISNILEYSIENISKVSINDIDKISISSKEIIESDKEISQILISNNFIYEATLKREYKGKHIEIYSYLI